MGFCSERGTIVLGGLLLSSHIFGRYWIRVIKVLSATTKNSPGSEESTKSESAEDIHTLQ